MIVDFVKLQKVGLFHDPVTIGPLSQGLNVLAANNEEGKSTIIRALVRALFDRYNSTAEEIKQLQPVGTSLAPEVTVDFQTGNEEYRVQKRFLLDSYSLLFTKSNNKWQRIAEDDEADRQLRDLLGGNKSHRGATKPKHWGLLSYLWAQQGKTIDWPNWSDPTGEMIQKKLARVQIDPLVDELCERFQAEQNDCFTPTGKVRKNSPLDQAGRKASELQKQIQACQKQREEVETIERQHQQLAKEIPLLEKQLRKKEHELQTLQQQNEAVNIVNKEIQHLSTELERAKNSLQQVDSDEQRLQEIEKEQQNCESQRQEIEKQVTRQQGVKTEFQKKVLQVEEKEEKIRRRIPEANNARDRLNALLELISLRIRIQSRKRQLDRIDKEQQALDELKTEKAKLPDIKPQTLSTMKALDKEINNLQAKLEAAGIQVEITPHQESQVDISSEKGGETVRIKPHDSRTFSAARQLGLNIRKWGSIRIRSGAEELQTMESSLRKKRETLKSKLQNWGVESVDEAKKMRDKAKELDTQIKRQVNSIKDYLDEWESREAVSRQITVLDGQVDRLRKKWEPSEAEEAKEQSELQTERANAEYSVEQLNNQHNEALDSAKALRKQSEQAAKEEQVLQDKLSEYQQRLSNLTSSRKEIRKRYPEGIKSEKSKVQRRFTEAEARYNTKKDELPEEHEKIPERLKQTKNGAGHIRDKLNQKHKEEATLRGRLQSEASGVYSRETELNEQLHMTGQKLQQIRSHTMAARLLNGMLQNHKEQMVQSLLAPLEEELTSTFAELTDNHSRHVYLDENLQIEGIGNSRDSLIQFEQLSQGAREQILLALRGAIAKELGEENPQILILDDVLVNTDPIRQQNVIDFLKNLSNEIQCLVLTCHSGWYEGAGTQLSIKPVRVNNSSK